MLEEELDIFGRNNYQINDSIRAKEKQNKLLIDSISQISDSITTNENKLLFQRTQRVMFYSKIVFWIIIGAELVSVLLIVYSLVTFNMESQAKKKPRYRRKPITTSLKKSS
jgi:CHASE3 domain sensor protein